MIIVVMRFKLIIEIEIVKQRMLKEVEKLEKEDLWKTKIEKVNKHTRKFKVEGKKKKA